MCLVQMDEERGRIRSLLPLVVGVGGLGLAVAMIVDGVQKNAAAARRVNQPVDHDTLETRAEDLALPAETDEGLLDDAPLDDASLDKVSLAEEAPLPKEVPAPKEVPLSKLDKRSLYKQAYEKARRRAPIDPRATMVARFQST